MTSLENRISERISTEEFKRDKENVFSSIEFDADMKKRLVTWLITNDDEAEDLLSNSVSALEYIDKFKLKNEEWKELDKHETTFIDWAINGKESSGIGIEIFKICNHKNCRKRVPNHYLFYFQINIRPCSCAVTLPEYYFDKFIKKLDKLMKKTNDEIINLQLICEPTIINFRLSTRELNDLKELLNNFKPSHEELGKELRTAFIRYKYCNDCAIKNKIKLNQQIQFGVFQIYEDEEEFGLPNTVAEFSEDELQELIYAFNVEKKSHNEKLYGKISRNWK